MTIALDPAGARPIRPAPPPPAPPRPWIGGGMDGCEPVNRAISAPMLEGIGRNWWIAVAAAGGVTVLMLAMIAIALWQGVGVWGNNSTIVWGFDIANYVWWIGIGNAGTLISALLLLTRQPWRASINRFAEAMTLFAASIAGIFPIIHLGRPMFFYWLMPYPNPMALWPNWRSPLVWDFWAIASYLLFSLVFWYTGLIPDLATLRDRARLPLTRKLYGAFSLGWRNSARHWDIHQTFYRTMAGLAVPLVCSVHSIVGLDFAASVEPGWQESLFPPYFVVGAMFSGFAMVVLLASSVRLGLHVQSFITPRHFDSMAKIMLVGALVMTLSYATEWFMGWYGGERAERSFLSNAFIGPYGWLYALMLLGNCLGPQVLWFKRMRSSLPVLIVVSIGILVGMWLERILIIWNTLGHDYLPSLWRVFFPSIVDHLTLLGTVGFFTLMFLVFVRILPAVSMYEVRELAMEGPRA